MGHWLRPPLLLRPAAGWAQTTGTVTLVQPSAGLAYWEFTDNGAVNTIEITMPMLDLWAGRTISSLEATWATDGTLTSAMVIRSLVYNYVAGTDLANGTGTSIDNSGSVSITPLGTAHSMSRVNYASGGAFTAGADLIRILFQRRTSDAADVNTDALRLYGIRLALV